MVQDNLHQLKQFDGRSHCTVLHCHNLPGLQTSIVCTVERICKIVNNVCLDADVMTK